MPEILYTPNRSLSGHNKEKIMTMRLEGLYGQAAQFEPVENAGLFRLYLVNHVLADVRATPEQADRLLQMVTDHNRNRAVTEVVECVGIFVLLGLGMYLAYPYVNKLTKGLAIAFYGKI